MNCTPHCSGVQIKKNEMDWASGTYAYRILVGRPEGKSPLGKPRRRREDNIKIVLQQIGWETRSGFIWIRIGAGDGLM